MACLASCTNLVAAPTRFARPRGSVKSADVARWSAIATLETPTVCAGATASYVLRRIAFCAGAFAPGIDEAIFAELHTSDNGRTIDDVARWLAARTNALSALGYRLQYRRVVSPTPKLLAWVNAGRGYRGAVLPTSYCALHAVSRELGDAVQHAVGIAIENEPSRDRELIAIDPWPRKGEHTRALPAELESAHRERHYEALALHWVGWA